MNIQFTARHFKAPSALQSFAEEAIMGLTHIYEGIVSAEVVVEDGQQGGQTKVAEIGLLVYREKLFAKETSDDMNKSIQACVDKLERQLIRYKDKLHGQDRPHERPDIPDTDISETDISDND